MKAIQEGTTILSMMADRNGVPRTHILARYRRLS
jgi:hypothetical protein